jgi:hypothetical protein
LPRPSTSPLPGFSLILCILLILTPTDHRFALLTFIAGSGLGYYLELWGTTRQCWTYYTYQTPPLFAVLAHGMAAVAFWRAGLNAENFWEEESKNSFPFTVRNRDKSDMKWHVNVSNSMSYNPAGQKIVIPSKCDIKHLDRGWNRPIM